MGFRSTFVAMESYGPDWPLWFRDKWRDFVNFGPVLSSKHEAKTYSDAHGSFFGIEDDIHRALSEIGYMNRAYSPFVMVWLHECGGITRVEFHEDGVVYTEPTGWRLEPDGPSHYYCGNCSVSRSANAT